MNRSNAPDCDASTDKVAEARIEAQNAAQWLARMTQSFGASAHPQEVHLHWDRAKQKIVTPEVAPGLTLELALPTLTLQFAEQGKPSPHAIDIDGKSSAEVEAWLLVEMLHRGFERENFSKQLPYKWSRLMTGDEAKYTPQSLVQELEQLADWFDDAANVLMRVRKALNDGGFESQDFASPASTELVCWPEKFEIGFTVPIFPDSGENGTVKVGFSVGDEKNTSPGFFVRRAPETSASKKADILPLPPTDEDGRDEQIIDRLVAEAKEIRMSSSN